MCAVSSNEQCCDLYSFVMFGVDAIGDHIVKAYSNIGLVTALCVKSNASVCSPEERTLSIGIVLDDFAIVLSMCLL